MLRCTLLATIGLLATASILPAQTPASGSSPQASAPAIESPEPMEEAQTGDHWTYEFRDDITGDIKSTITNTVTDISASEVGMRLQTLGSPNFGYQTLDRPGI